MNIEEKYSRILDELVIAFATQDETIIQEKVQITVDYGRHVCNEIYRLKSIICEPTLKDTKSNKLDKVADNLIVSLKAKLDKLIVDEIKHFAVENQKLRESMSKLGSG